MHVTRNMFQKGELKAVEIFLGGKHRHNKMASGSSPATGPPYNNFFPKH